MKIVMDPESKWSIATPNIDNIGNNQPLFGWKHGHIVAAVLSRAQLCSWLLSLLAKLWRSRPTLYSSRMIDPPYICPVLLRTCPASVLSCICPVLHLSCPAILCSVLCQSRILSFNLHFLCLIVMITNQYCSITI